MQPAAQAAIVAGCSVTAYLMAKLTPSLPSRSIEHEQDVSKDEIKEISPPSKVVQESPKIEALQTMETQTTNPWNMQSTDLALIELITKESLSSTLQNSSEIAKQKALEIGKFGFPSYDNLAFYDSYCSSTNYRTSCPNWSGEFISRQDLEINEEVDRSKCPPFSECEYVPEKFRSMLADYKRSGFSRGHLAPAGDHNSCQLNKDLTFQLSSNIVPQELSMNGCDWLRVERFVKSLVTSNDTDIQRCWIFSGPVYKPRLRGNDDTKMYSKPLYIKKECKEGEDDKGEMEKIVKTFNAPKCAEDGRLKGTMRYNTIGKTMVHVPTHLYKVILAERGEVKEEDEVNKYQLAAFMVQNEAIHDILPLTDYLVDIDELEHYVGLQFFPRLRYNKDTENVIKYGDLCKNYNCEYDDDERVKGWRPLGIIKTAKDLDELERVWRETCDRGFEKDWMKSMMRRCYNYRKKDLIRPIQKRINYMRQFQ